MASNSDYFGLGSIFLNPRPLEKMDFFPWTSISLLWFMLIQNLTYPGGEPKAQQNFLPALEPAAIQDANGSLISWRKMFLGSFYVRVSKSRKVNSFSMKTRRHLMLIQQLKMEQFKKWWPFGWKTQAGGRIWCNHFCLIGVYFLFFSGKK